jgi:hypothetical protein
VTDADEMHATLKSLQAESALSLVQEQEDAQSNIDSTTSPALPEPLDVPDANLILRSSDLVNFRVHKPVLTMASPFFKDLLSLPRPSDSESIADGFPVVQLSEDATLLNSLVSMLYHVHPGIPDSYEKVLHLLAACQKYQMVQVQSYIRAEVNHGNFPVPVKTEAFRAYAIASGKGLIPEMEKAARLTLDHPMTFETIGEGLRLFQGSALRDLAHFRKRCSDNLVTCLYSFLKVQADPPGPSSIWVGCPKSTRLRCNKVDIPVWLYVVLPYRAVLLQAFTHPLPTPQSVRAQYLKAIQDHSDCSFCLRVYAEKGSNFGEKLERRLARAREKVHTSFLDFEISENQFVVGAR